MNKMIVILIIIILAVAVIIGGVFVIINNKGNSKNNNGLIGNTNGVNANSAPFEFESFRLSENNMSAVLEVYEAQRIKDGVRLARIYEYMGSDEKTVVREIKGGEELLEEIELKLGELNIESWNGFYGKNPPDVLDGSSMSFEAKMMDGSDISACGTNNFPENYYEFKQYLFDLLQNEILETNTFTGKCYNITLPDSWIGKVKVSYEEDFNAFSMPIDGRDLLLMRVDFRSYELNDKSKITDIGTIRSKDGSEELYLAVLNYESYMKEDEGTQEQYEIYQSFKDDLPKIIESITLTKEYEYIEK